ncbi:sigma-54 dependent transcriptional regulator [Sporomusa sp. KB1]|jgi:DNA-binding NtrC family response regulator|uniref:sigma-54-dependent transcriptional regulator n=1 Tax=Sporomusa sp. KB1 TaxID=943346 RepID=UPI00119E8768|nr:sigma-54 dependent transcriptional regulator [Sporomusa sp. KB1]TWH46377.1 DNA-binding NtrC family response regulator [Sporomusa sp. KB1]
MRVLLVDDDQVSRVVVKRLLQNSDCEVTECSNAAEALAKLVDADYPMVLSDINMPGMSGIELAQAIKQLSDSWRTDIVLFTGYADIKSAVAALRAGVYDYLQKPVDAQELALTIDRVAEHQALLRENKKLTDRFQDEVCAATEATRRELSTVKKVLAESIIGQVGVFGESTRQLLEQAQQFHTDRSIPVLIQGETGVGKEVIAKAIHYGVKIDELTNRPFVAINCSALTPSLFESEMFGYEAGAFTGSATQGAKGKFDMAQNGTLFLDEIGEIPLNLQAKLLRVLQEKEFYRVGGLKKIKIDIRIICATNSLLEEQVKNGAFRQDLYYRLKVGYVKVPPLRERKGEIVPLANAFLLDAARQKKKRFHHIVSAAARLLNEYPWPGNIRELKNVIEYVAFAYDAEELQVNHLSHLLGEESRSQAFSQVLGTDAAKQQLVLPFPSGGYSLKSFCDDIVDEVIAACEGNYAAAAKYLGISLRALFYRLEKKRIKQEISRI